MSNNKKQQALNVDETLKEQESFFSKNQKSIIYGAIVAVLLTAGVIIYNTQVAAPREKSANVAIFKAEQYFANQDFEKALNGEGEGVLGFVQVAEQYSSTKAGNLAKMYAGLCNAKLGNWDEAVKYLEKYSACGDQMVSPAAMGTLGNAYAQLGQLDKATATLLKAAKSADNNSLSPLYLLQAGEIFESQGNASKALDCYKQIKEKYFGSMQYQDIEKYIERASK